MYKELVEKLRHRGTLYNGISLFDDAANAIEKLLFKNEFLKCLRLEAENKELKRERDQAVEELHRNTDAVPVVRCKDCKWFTMDNTGGTYCNHLTCGLFNGYEPDAFCSYGERKESNE
mgnify:CR=1 FL=1